MEICKVTPPKLKKIGDKHEVSCLLYEEQMERLT